MSDSLATAYRNILQTARHLERLSQSHLPIPFSLPKPRVETRLHDDAFTFHLPDKDTTIARIVQCGINRLPAEHMCEIYLSTASNLRATTAENFSQTIAKLSCLPGPSTSMAPRKIFLAYKAKFDSSLSTMLDGFITRAKQRIDQESKKQAILYTGSTQQAKEYVPLLEHFFVENAFPSHADKAFLAKKTNMSYRQIHVWFQNRRNRTRKDGRDLRRKPSHEASTVPFDRLITRLSGYIIPECSRVREPDSDILDSDCSENDISHFSKAKDPPILDVLNPKAPSHAFPASYPPSCDYDPFPCKNGTVNLPVPSWERHPAENIKCPPLPIDYETLVVMFSKMNMCDQAANKVKKRSRSGSIKSAKILRTPYHARDYGAAVLFIGTKPFSAPLPALLPSSSNHTCMSPCSLPSIRAPTSRLHVFNTPSPQSKPASLVPVREVQPGTSSRRKLAPLPKRIPKGANISHRGIIPAMSEASVIPSLSLKSPSRMSSYGSSETRLFSETSSSSSSPRVRTPATSSTSLPRIVTPTLSMPGFSPYQRPSSMNDLFADSPVGTPSQVEGLQLDMNFFGDPHIAKASDFDFFGVPPSTNLVHA